MCCCFLFFLFTLFRIYTSVFLPYTNITTKLSIIVFVINVPGTVPPVITVNKLKESWYLMQNYLSNCTYGKVVLSSYDAIIDLTSSEYAMPLSGKSVYSNTFYNITRGCGSFEPYAMQEWAQFMFSKITSSNKTISNYQRRIVVMPSFFCDAYGFGSQGCIGLFCYIWIRGDKINNFNIFFSRDWTFSKFTTCIKL